VSNPADVRVWADRFTVAARVPANSRSPRRKLVVIMVHLKLSDGRSWRWLVAATSWQSSDRYRGARSLTRTAILNSTCCRTGSQCSWWKTGVTWSHLRVAVIKRAAAFCTAYDRRSRRSKCVSRVCPDNNTRTKWPLTCMFGIAVTTTLPIGLVRFVGQYHTSEFTITGGKCC